jgi:hypothetical protein
VAKTKPPPADGHVGRRDRHAATEDAAEDSPGREWTRYWIRPDGERHPGREWTRYWITPDRERHPRRDRLAALIWAMGTIAMLPYLSVYDSDSDPSHLFTVLLAVGLALYLCAGLLYIPDIQRDIQRLRYRNHREPRRVVEDEPGVEASRPQSASPPGPIDVPEDEPPQHAPAVPDDAAADHVRPAPGHSTAE